MITFLFWNMNRKPLSGAIAAIAKAEFVDVLMLAECPIEPAGLLRTLNSEEPAYHFAPGQNERIPIFARFPRRYIPAVYESDRVSIRRLILPPIDAVTLVVVHFPSKLHLDDASQMMECTVLANTITEIEQQLGHRRTIVVGDLNMNPFEAGVVGAVGLHAVATRAIAGKNTRTVQGKSYPFFYNPMWGHFGDASDRPPGTYYYERAGHVNYFWNNFDQVLIRPQLMDSFRSDHLRILDRAGDLSLSLDDGRPDHAAASDHFPLLFTLDV